MHSCDLYIGVAYRRMMKVESLVGCTLNNGRKYFQNVWALPGHELSPALVLQTGRWRTTKAYLITRSGRTRFDYGILKRGPAIGVIVGALRLRPSNILARPPPRSP